MLRFCLKRPAKYPQGEAEEYFKSAQKMAADSSAAKWVSRAISVAAPLQTKNRRFSAAALQ